MNKKFCIIVTTTNEKEIANLIAKTLIENKLAACVQLDEVESFFYHDVGIKQEMEVRLFIKASDNNYKAIEKLIKLNHNYQLPQIVKLDIADGSSEYLSWLNNNT